MSKRLEDILNLTDGEWDELENSEPNNINNNTMSKQLEDLRKFALDHYESASRYDGIYSTDIPKAINEYYDNKIREEKKANISHWVGMILITIVIVFYIISLIVLI